MADDTRAQAPARGRRLVVPAGFVGFTLTFAASHFLLPIRLLASVSESTVTLFLSAVVATLTAAVAAPLLSRNLRLENQRMRGAINNMSQGLCMFDGNERLVVCNRRYMQMYNLSADIVTPRKRCTACSNTDAKSSKNRSSFGIKAWNQRSIEDLVSDSRETIRSVWVAKSGSDRLRTPATDHPVTNFNTMKNKSFMAGLLRRKICCNGSAGRIACRSECSKWRMLDAVGLLHHARSPDGPGLVPDAA